MLSVLPTLHRPHFRTICRENDSDTLADNFLNGAKAWARNSVDRAVVAAKHMLGNIGWLFAPAYFEKMRAQQHSERLNMGPGSVFVDGNDTWCSSGNVARITLLMSSPTRAKALVYEHTHLDNQDETTPKILQLTGVALDRLRAASGRAAGPRIQTWR